MPVNAVRSLHEAGYTVAQIRDEYPGLTAADVKAALSVQGVHRADGDNAGRRELPPSR